jgi:hypothetical protein
LGLKATTVGDASRVDWPPPHADIAAAASNDRHPLMGGILAGRNGMDAEAASSDGFIST